MKISELNGQLYGECKKCGSLELYDLMLLTEGGNK